MGAPEPVVETVVAPPVTTSVMAAPQPNVYQGQAITMQAPPVYQTMAAPQMIETVAAPQVTYAAAPQVVETVAAPTYVETVAAPTTFAPQTVMAAPVTTMAYGAQPVLGTSYGAAPAYGAPVT